MKHLFGGSYTGRRVFVTGHTGFKGSWLTLWLRSLGADVTGYSLPPPTVPSMFDIARVGEGITHIEADVRDAARLRDALAQAQPDVVFHLAAQAIVRLAYEQPRETLDVNVMGTANLLEAVRAYASKGRPCTVVVITSDKCYENREWVHGYRETDRLGGNDPYSMSKAAAELVAASWRRTFFPADRIGAHGVRLATARAGNVIGGGDWAADRLLPDCIAALTEKRPIAVRNPDAVRPWQHVLEPLGGYLHLGARLMASEPRPPLSSARPGTSDPPPEACGACGKWSTAWSRCGAARPGKTARSRMLRTRQSGLRSRPTRHFIASGGSPSGMSTPPS